MSRDATKSERPGPRAMWRPPMGLRAVVAAAALAWALLGIFGVFRYVQAYWLYRGFAPPVTPRGVAAGRLLTRAFSSPALHARSAIDVYLPPGYRQAVAMGRRFPVVYLLHGEPGQPNNFFFIGDLHVAENVLLARHRIRPMILVAPSGRSARFGAETEWANTRAGNFEDYVLDVVRYTDAHFATIPDRRDRVLAGLSEGGFGAANIALRHLAVFGGFQSWSGYFRESPTGPFAHASPAQVRANSPLAYVPALAPTIRRLGLHAYVYAGRADRSGARQLLQFAPVLRAAGTHVTFSLYHGGHDWGLWRREGPHMLSVANRWFTAASTVLAARTPAIAGAPRRARARGVVARGRAVRNA
jgi:enterochelin esterase-like enzyme